MYCNNPELHVSMCMWDTQNLSLLHCSTKYIPNTLAQVVGCPDPSVNDITLTQGQLSFLTSPPLTPSASLSDQSKFLREMKHSPSGSLIIGMGPSYWTLLLKHSSPSWKMTLQLDSHNWICKFAGSVDITVTRGWLEDGSQVGNTDVSATVQLSTSDGTATAGQDYTTQSLTLTFAPDSTSQNLTILILTDNTP